MGRIAELSKWPGQQIYVWARFRSLTRIGLVSSPQTTVVSNWLNSNYKKKKKFSVLSRAFFQIQSPAACLVGYSFKQGNFCEGLNLAREIDYLGPGSMLLFLRSASKER